MLDAAAGRVAAGATVELRPSDSSMFPLIGPFSPKNPRPFHDCVDFARYKRPEITQS